MKKYDPLSIVLSAIDKEYHKEIPIKEIMKDIQLLKESTKFAERNGLYYYFILRLNELNVDTSCLDKSRWAEELDKLSRFKGTFSFLDNMQKVHDIDYMLIKACTNIPHVPRDVDVLVHIEDMEKVLDVFTKGNMTISYSNNVETSFNKEGCMKLDIYTGIQYVSMEFIDEKFLWESKIDGSIFEIIYPNLKDDANFLLLLVHSIFGHRSMTLLDFLNMMSILNDIKDINICRNHAYDKGWGEMFDISLERLELIRGEIYDKGHIVSFPYMFDKKFMMECITLANINMDIYERLFMSASLFLDRIGHDLERTPFHKYLMRFGTGRRVFNSLCYFVRHKRGDSHGLKREKKVIV